MGGGSILSNKVRNLLKKSFRTIFLDIDFSILVERLQNSSKRPLLENVNIEEKIHELDVIRRKYYLTADIIIKDHDIPRESINKILKKLSKLDEKKNKY